MNIIISSYQTGVTHTLCVCVYLSLSLSLFHSFSLCMYFRKHQRRIKLQRLNTEAIIALVNYWHIIIIIIYSNKWYIKSRHISCKFLITTVIILQWVFFLFPWNKLYLVFTRYRLGPCLVAQLNSSLQLFIVG